MDERPKIDLKKHQLPPVSKRYMLRIIVYIVVLVLLGLAIRYLYKQNSVKNHPDIKQIEGVTIELED
jgi:hypothetical protein